MEKGNKTKLINLPAVWLTAMLFAAVSNGQGTYNSSGGYYGSYGSVYQSWGQADSSRQMEYQTNRMINLNMVKNATKKSEQ